MKASLAAATLAATFAFAPVAEAQVTSSCNFRYNGYKTVDGIQIARMNGSYKPGTMCQFSFNLGASLASGHVVVLGARLHKKPKNGRASVSRNRVTYTPRGSGTDEFLVEYKLKNLHNTGYRYFLYKLKPR
jgi:hypothetical protein